MKEQIDHYTTAIHHISHAIEEIKHHQRNGTTEADRQGTQTEVNEAIQQAIEHLRQGLKEGENVDGSNP